MLIVNSKRFLELPSGTLYAKYEPCVFGNLEIKCDTWGNDFVRQSLVDAIECSNSGELGELLDTALETGASLRMDFNCAGRDGCFDEGQLFAVFEPADVEAMVKRINQA